LQVANAIKDLDVEITAENAVSRKNLLHRCYSSISNDNVAQMGFSKGKMKIAGVGPTTAKKMKEFMESGTIEKLEEKRALASGES
jgi:DNA polymerase/3'-5' exonuclease PolX